MRFSELRDPMAQAATRAAERSSHPSVKVGCSISAGHIWVGSQNRPAAGCVDRTGPTSDGLYRMHAEEAAVAAAAYRGIRLSESTAWVTHRPCARCTRLLIEAGVAVLHHGPDVHGWPEADYAAAAAMLRDAGIEVHAYE